MNTQRVIVLGLALVAACGAALMVRSMIGGGTPHVEAKPVPAMAMSEVLVANTNLQPGQPLDATQVRWEKWPTTSVDASFITHAATGSEEEAVKGQVVRSPIVAGQPIVNTAIVKADSSGFMAAMLTPGMRAVSITINTDSGAGGFILPNDRVDVLMTRKFTQTDPPLVVSDTILSNVRVLAVDQTFKQEKGAQTVLAKSATLELTPAQAEIVTRSAVAGSLSLVLRPLGDLAPVASLSDRLKNYAETNGPVNVIRYGLSGNKLSLNQEKPQ
ncbi:MAG TPA: Flp pilus assembly protein CpaB [Rhizomicrobium sp.]|jgi:pilus assembly protein CpaB|nr:Flp pilus assembly protein CpaB [Rhizomicrobium sp.]HWA70020.1 Flp pilus assembly protein CpaB [Rhizomicrobium sp.]